MAKKIEKLIAARPTLILGRTAKPGTELGTIGDNGRIKPNTQFHEQLTVGHIEARMRGNRPAIVRESALPAAPPVVHDPGSNDGNDESNPPN